MFKDTRTVVLVSLWYLNKFYNYDPPYRNHELYLHHASVGWLLQYGCINIKSNNYYKNIYTYVLMLLQSLYLSLIKIHAPPRAFIFSFGFCFQGEIFRTFYQTKHLPKVKYFVVDLNSKSPFGSISGRLPFSITLENNKKPKVFLFFHGV